jgi:hypothetical protein
MLEDKREPNNVEKGFTVSITFLRYLKTVEKKHYSKYTFQ